MAANKKNPGLLLRNAGIFNPVLVQAVGLCPVVAIATTLKGSVILAGIAAVVITLSELIASLMFKPIPRWVRIGLYIIIGGGLVAPFMLWLEKADTALFGSLGIYLPVMAVNSLIVLRCERFAVKISPVSALLDGLTASVGYAAVLIFVGTVREIVGSGSIAGYRFWERRTFPGVLLPFAGFIIIGFSGAILRAVISVYWPKYLDKKQPKPKDKRKPAPKKARVSAAAIEPDLSPDDSPFSLADISDTDDDVTEETETNETETETEASAETETGIETETAAEITPELPEPEEKPAEESHDTEDDGQSIESPAAEQNTSDDYEDLSFDEVLTDETPLPENESAENEYVDDNELEALMNRSTDDIIAKVKEPETEKDKEAEEE